MTALWWWPLVRAVAGQMIRRMPASVDRRDLEMAGAERVLKARVGPAASDAERATFVRRHALGGMLDELRAADPIDRRTRRLMRRVDAAGHALLSEGKRPTAEAIAERAGVSPAQALEATVLLSRHTDAPALDQVVQPDELMEQRQSMRALHDAVARLPAAQREAMQARLRGADTRETARELGISREALWARESAARATLRLRLRPAAR